MDYKKLDEYIGNELYKARVINRISQEQITDTINKKLQEHNMCITRQSYSNYERGKYSIPQGVLEIACNELNLDWKKILSDGVEEMKKGLGI